MKRVSVLCVVIIITISSVLSADVKLPAIIGSNMALQQNAEVKIWGWAEPGERVAIEPSWQTDSVKTAANADGRWCAAVKTEQAGGGHTMAIRGNNTIEIDNIIFGEVWLCSGQSNMQMRMGADWDKQPIKGGPEDIAASANSLIRFFTVAPADAEQPQEDVKGSWVECSPETVKDFSAVGYYFGRKVQKETGLPMGLICSAYGGTLAQAWTRIDYIRNDDFLSSMFGAYSAKHKQWQEECLKAQKEQKPEPNQSWLLQPQHKPASLYNAMIAPITNLTIKGVIWYQGESNANAAHLYRDLFPTMIQNWRCDFGNYQMPFYFVQLANYTKHDPGAVIQPYRGQPRDNDWAELREAQLMTNAMKNTGMAVTIDIGETNCVHPANKKDVGERLALWALTKLYGKCVDYSGPLYAGYKIEGDKIRIFFDHAENGLKLKDGKAVGFAIAGADRKFVWADAQIDGSTVLVSSETLKEPVAVRYAWDMDPENCLYDQSNLPASPFRTDDWNGVTIGVKL